MHSRRCAQDAEKASEEAAQTQVPTTQETTTQAATSAPEILIQSDEGTKGRNERFAGL